MTVIDLHPDELLDRARHGALSADERARLDEHLAHCVACRMEQLLVHDFAEEARRASDSGLAAQVSGALIAASKAPSMAPRPRRRTSGWGWAVAATLLLGSGLATAQSGLIEQALHYARTEWLGDAAPASARRPITRAATLPRPHAAQKVEAPAIVAAVEPSAPVPSPTPPVIAPSRITRAAARTLPEAASTRRATPAPAIVRAEAPAPTMAPTLPTVMPAPSLPIVDRPAAPSTPTSVPAVEPVTSSAPRLFEHANDLRHAGRAREASEVYGDLTARFPNSAEARLALVLRGRLELDHGDPALALTGFDAYLAAGDRALREQALSGRALALGRLGRDGDACTAFRTLLDAFPSSTYASVAARRCPEAH